MRVAVMQPYLFPYLGYFQLIQAVDHFVFYDDVQFIKQGYVNRNRMSFGDFTVPLAAGPAHARINERRIAVGLFPRFRRKWLRSFDLRYAKSPHGAAARAVATSVWADPPENAAELAEASVRAVCKHLALTGTTFGRASELAYDRSAGGQARLLSLLATLGATEYVNSPNGRALYDPVAFRAAGVRLRFLRPRLIPDDQSAEAYFSVLHQIAHHGSVALAQPSFAVVV